MEAFTHREAKNMMKTQILRAAAGALLAAELLAFGSAACAAPIDDGVAYLKAGKYPEAMKVFKAEAAKDVPDAFFYIGDMVNQGLGQKSIPLQATDWWEKGAYLGSEKCQLALSMAYRNGVGVRVEPRQALLWDREAARAGSIVAMKNIGDYFATGNGVEIDAKEAAKWYYRAAKGGYPEGLRALGDLLKSGEGAPKNLQAAYVLIQAAAKPVEEKGWEADRNAAADARILGHSLTADELAAAEKTSVADVLKSLAALDPEPGRM